MNMRAIGSIGVVVLALATNAIGLAQSGPSTTSTPPPPPLPNTNRTQAPIVVPSASAAAPGNALPTVPPRTPTPAPARPGRPTPTPEATDTPAPPQFNSMDGVWEVQQQQPTKTVYSHLNLTQKESDLSGTWTLPDGKTKVPLTGNFDGRLFKLTGKMTSNGASQDVSFSGYVDNYSDIVGLLAQGTNSIPITAAHRKKERFFQ